MSKTLIDEALALEGVEGIAAELVKSIYQQESGSGSNSKTSNRGAVGGMQILPTTFNGVADEGWDIKNPLDNARAGIRYALEGLKKGGGDPRLAAAYYYGGPNGLKKAALNEAVFDSKNPNAPSTLQYADQVASRMGLSGSEENSEERGEYLGLASELKSQNTRPASQPYSNGRGEYLGLVSELYPQKKEKPATAKPAERDFFENFGSLAKQGFDSAVAGGRIADDVATGNIDDNSARIIAGQLNKQDIAPKELKEVQAEMARTSKEGAEAGSFAENPLGNMKAFGNMLYGIGEQLITNPKGVAYMTAEQMANMAPSIVGMIGGAKVGGAAGAIAAPVTGGLSVPIGAAVGGFGGAFAGEWQMEAGSQFIGSIGKELQARGLAPTEENVTALLTDQKLREKIISESRSKATVTSAVDSLFTLGAGRLVSAPARAAQKQAIKELGETATKEVIEQRAKSIIADRTFKQKIVNGGKALALDATGGGASEAAGQQYAYGEVDLGEVQGEILGEIGGAGIEIPAASYAVGKDTYQSGRDKLLAQKAEKEAARKEQQTNADAAMAAMPKAQSVDDAIALATEAINTPIEESFNDLTDESIDLNDVLGDENVSDTAENVVTGLDSAAITQGSDNPQRSDTTELLLRDNSGVDDTTGGVAGNSGNDIPLGTGNAQDGAVSDPLGNSEQLPNEVVGNADNVASTNTQATGELPAINLQDTAELSATSTPATVDNAQSAPVAPKPLSQKPKKTISKKSNTLLTRLRDLGGVGIENKSDITGERGKGFAAGGYNQIFRKDTKASLKGHIENGDLDDYLPPAMRLSSSTMQGEAYDSTDAYDYLADRIRNGEKVLPYDTEEEIKANQFYQQHQEQEIPDGNGINDDEINKLLSEAGYDERERDAENRIYGQGNIDQVSEITEQGNADSNIVSAEREQTRGTGTSGIGQKTPNEIARAPQTNERQEARPLVETIVKRRAAANQIGKGKAFDTYLAKAKQFLAGGDVNPTQFKLAAGAFKSDPALADAFTQLEAMAKAPRAEATAEKKSVVEAYKERIGQAQTAQELQSLAKEIQRDSTLKNGQATYLDNAVMGAMDALENVATNDTPQERVDENANDRQDFTLTGETNAEILAKEKAKKAEEEAQAKAEKDAQAEKDKKATEEAQRKNAGERPFVFGEDDAIVKRDVKAGVDDMFTQQEAIEAIKQDDTIPTAEKIKLAADLRRGDVSAEDVSAIVGEAKQTQKIDDLGEKIGGARKDTALPTGKSPSKKAKTNDDKPTWAKRYSIMQVPDVMMDHAGEWSIFDTKDKDRLGNPRMVGGRNNYYKTKEAAEADLPLIAVAIKHRAYATAKRDDGSYGYEIYRNISDRKRVKVVDKVFDGMNQALEYMAKNAESILETNTIFGEIDLPVPEITNRVGVERRKGDVQGQDFMDTFGFRGVEFGNWNNQTERQQLMNAAYDGLMDLADVLNLPPKALALNGDLALAFGARGQGLSSAKAHYELDKVVINLTKMNGAGSLAHEWFHALDHYFARQGGQSPNTWEVGADGTRTLKENRFPTNDFISSGFSTLTQVRPELVEAYKALMEVMTRKAAVYVEDTAKADKFVATAKEQLAQKLDRLRKDLSEQRSPVYGKRHSAPASAEQLVQFDTIVKQLLDGQGLDAEYRPNDPDGKVRRRGTSLNGRRTNDALEALSKIYKDVRGRSGFDSTHNRGVMDYIRSDMSLYSTRLKMLADAQSGSEKIKQVPTSFAMNAKELDQGRASDYWTTPHEMAARAFQGYVEDKVAEKGGSSPFLNYGREGAGILTPWGVKFPFPQGKERQAINMALDNFISQIKTKETDNGNVAMFSRDSAFKRPQSLYDQLFGVPDELKQQVIDGAQRTVDAIRANWENAPDVEVVYDMDDERISEMVRDENERQLSQGATGVPEGFFDGGKVYIVASALRTPQDVARVLFHETLGHYGLRGTFGKDLTKILDQVASLKKNVVHAKAKQYGLAFTQGEAIEKVQAWAKANEIELTNQQIADRAAKLLESDRLIAAEEVLAEMAQTTPEIGYVKRAIAAIRNWLRANVPYFKDMDLSDADIIEAYILPARNYVVNGGANSALNSDGARYSLSNYIQSATSKWSDLVDKYIGNQLDKSKIFELFDTTPASMQVIGMPDLPVKISSHSIDYVNERFTEQQLKQLPIELSDPVIAYVADDTKTGGVSANFVTSIKSNNGKVVVAIKPNANHPVAGKSNYIATMMVIPDMVIEAKLRQGRALYVGDLSAEQGYKSALDKAAKEKGTESVNLRKSFLQAFGSQRPNIRIMRKSDAVNMISRGDAKLSRSSLPDTIAVDGIERPTLNSNGKPIHPTREGVEKFWRWFGGSVTVDENGAPIVYYHGTRREFDVFEPSQPRGAIGNPKGIYFDTDKRVALEYAEDTYGEQDVRSRVIEVYLRVTGNTDGVIKNRTERGNKEQEVIVFNHNQIKSAVGNTGDFNPANPSILFSRSNNNERIIGDSEREYTPAQLKALERTGSVVKRKTFAEKWVDVKQDLGKKLAQGLADQFRPIKDISSNAYTLLRLSKGASGAMEALMNYGKLSIKDGTFDADTSGGVLDKVFRPIGKEATDFLRWVAGNRAERLAKAGLERLFTDEDIAAFKSLSEGTTGFDYTLRDGTVTRDRTKIYADTLAKFNEFNKNVLDMAEQSGLIDGGSRKLWEHEFYVPFYRLNDDDPAGVRGMNIKKGVVRQEAFKKLKGGDAQLNDLMSNVLMNWHHLIDASAKNRAAMATVKAAENVGIATPTDGGGKNTVWFMENGQKKHFYITEPDVMDALVGLEFAGMRNFAMDAMSKTKHMLTIGVTASPFFKVRNLIRDSVQAIATSDLSYNPLGNVKQGWQLTDKSDGANQTYVSALAGGGLIRFGTMTDGNEAAHVRRLIKSGVRDEALLNSEGKLKDFWNRKIIPVVEAYNELGNRGEEVNRMALYDQLIKKGIPHSEASLMARDLMDFSMQGSWTAVRFLTQIVPFMNARIQGMYKLSRSATGSKESAAKMAIVTGAVTLVSLALLAAYGDDDDWKKREEWDRDNYWWFKVGGIAYRIPKPFEVGAVATLGERMAELAFDDEMTKERFAKVVLELTSNQLSMNPIPQAVKPIIDVYSNKDSFTGRDIESMSMERLAPDYRFNANTSHPARAISTVGNTLTGDNFLSPVQIDHLIHGYFGWLGSFIVGGADLVARGASDEPKRATLDYFKVATGGMAAQIEGSHSRYVTQVYEQAKELEQSYNTYRALLREGKKEDAAKYLNDNREDIAKYRNVEGVKKQMSFFQKAIKNIEKSESLSADEKRVKINALMARQEVAAKRLYAN